jgi:hypothetical protein
MGKTKIKLKKNNLSATDKKNLVTMEGVKNLFSQLKSEVEREMKITNLKLRAEINNLSQELKSVKSNQIVLQTMLRDQGTINTDNFQVKFSEYMRTKVGIVADGKMDGGVLVDIFNLGKDRLTPLPAKVKVEGKGPILVID